MINRLMVCLNALLKCLRTFREDVNQFATDILERRLPFLNLDLHIGPWKESRQVLLD